MHPFTSIRSQISRLLAEKDTVLVAIDGNATAGKTTLADRLAREFSCNVFHMDDFFLQPAQRTSQRLAEAGGNVDYERFRREILEPLGRGEPICYQPYDCRSRSLKEPVMVPPKPLTIVEGTYSCHPYFENPYDLTIFLAVSPEVQQKRVLQRPEFKHRMFFEVWIPMEQRYFDTFQIKESCHLLCSGQEELWG